VGIKNIEQRDGQLPMPSHESEPILGQPVGRSELNVDRAAETMSRTMEVVPAAILWSHVDRMPDGAGLELRTDCWRHRHCLLVTIEPSLRWQQNA